MVDANSGLEESLTKLLDEIRISNRHWLEVLEDPNFSTIRKTLKEASNPNKATFYRILHLERKDSFIDIGAGTGVISYYLSQDFQQGYALEPSQIFAELIKIRFKQDAINNIEINNSGFSLIPMKDNSFDLAIVDSVMPRIIRSYPQANLKSVQQNFVAEVKRVLTPGGKIVLAVNNRWDYRRLQNKMPHEEHLFSYRQNLKLLESVGYKNIKAHLVSPSLYRPTTVFSMERSTLNEFYLRDQGNSRIKKIIKTISDYLRKPYLLAYLGSSFYIEGQK